MPINDPKHLKRNSSEYQNNSNNSKKTKTFKLSLNLKRRWPPKMTPCTCSNHRSRLYSVIWLIRANQSVSMKKHATDRETSLLNWTKKSRAWKVIWKKRDAEAANLKIKSTSSETTLTNWHLVLSKISRARYRLRRSRKTTRSRSSNLKVSVKDFTKEFTECKNRCSRFSTRLGRWLEKKMKSTMATVHRRWRPTPTWLGMTRNLLKEQRR